MYWDRQTILFIDIATYNNTWYDQVTQRNIYYCITWLTDIQTKYSLGLALAKCVNYHARSKLMKIFWKWKFDHSTEIVENINPFLLKMFWFFYEIISGKVFHPELKRISSAWLGLRWTLMYNPVIPLTRTRTSGRRWRRDAIRHRLSLHHKSVIARQQDKQSSLTDTAQRTGRPPVRSSLALHLLRCAATATAVGSLCRADGRSYRERMKCSYIRDRVMSGLSGPQ